MGEYELPIVGGRKLLVRPCTPGPRPQVQVAILSTRGNIVDAVNLEATEVLGLCRAMGKAARAAQERAAGAIREERGDADRRYAEGLEVNPWLRGLRPDRERRGLR